MVSEVVGVVLVEEWAWVTETVVDTGVRSEEVNRYVSPDGCWLSVKARNSARISSRSS